MLPLITMTAAAVFLILGSETDLGEKKVQSSMDAVEPVTKINVRTLEIVPLNENSKQLLHAVVKPIANKNISSGENSNLKVSKLEGIKINKAETNNDVPIGIKYSKDNEKSDDWIK